MKLRESYTGCRLADGTLRVVRADGTELPRRTDLWNHSPSGFECGYGGSGPAQLALAILADFLEDDGRAARLHQRFKWFCVAELPRDAVSWTIGAGIIHHFLANERELERQRSVSN